MRNHTLINDDDRIAAIRSAYYTPDSCYPDRVYAILKTNPDTRIVDITEFFAYTYPAMVN